MVNFRLATAWTSVAKTFVLFCIMGLFWWSFLSHASFIYGLHWRACVWLRSMMGHVSISGALTVYVCFRSIVDHVSVP